MVQEPLPYIQPWGFPSIIDGVLTTILHSPSCDQAALTSRCRMLRQWPLPVFVSALPQHQRHSLPGQVDGYESHMPCSTSQACGFFFSTRVVLGSRSPHLRRVRGSGMLETTL